MTRAEKLLELMSQVRADMSKISANEAGLTTKEKDNKHFAVVSEAIVKGFDILNDAI